MKKTVYVNTKVPEMLVSWWQDFKAAKIKIHQWAITNMLETKIQQQKNEGIKKNQMEILEPQNTVTKTKYSVIGSTAAWMRQGKTPWTRI